MSCSVQVKRLTSLLTLQWKNTVVHGLMLDRRVMLFIMRWSQDCVMLTAGAVPLVHQLRLQQQRCAIRDSVSWRYWIVWSRLYLTLNREYKVAESLTTMTDRKLRKTLTMYRLSGHSRATETGRRSQNRLPRETRLCSLCHKGEVETESHLLLYCDKYKDLRKVFFEKNKSYTLWIYPPPSSSETILFMWGEKSMCSKSCKIYYIVIISEKQPFSRCFCDEICKNTYFIVFHII